MSYLTKKYSFLFFGILSLFISSCEETDISASKIEVCPHYNCADATVIQVTDQYFPSNHNFVKKDNRKYSAAWAEFLAFKYNIPLHVFEQNVKGKEFAEFLNTGRGGASIYYPSCHVDYRKSKIDSIKKEIENVYQKSISTLSYGCGKMNYTDSLPTYILGAKNSKYMSVLSNETSITWYGNGFGNSGLFDFSTKKMSLKRGAAGRFYNDIVVNNIDLKKVAEFTRKEVSETINTNGFYTNFMHWQDQSRNKNDSLIEGVAVMKSMFKAMNEGMVGGRNSGLDYNEAIEYLYAKQAVDSVQILNSTSSILSIAIQISKQTGVDYSTIDTPVTIRLRKDAVEDFEMNHIGLNEKLLSVLEDDENYYLNLLLDFNAPKNIITLNTKKERVEILELESALRSSKSWFFNNVRASLPSKFILFRRKKEAKDYEVEIADRTTTFSEKYELPELEEGYDYFCGAIDKKRQSTLIEL